MLVESLEPDAFSAWYEDRKLWDRGLYLRFGGCIEERTIWLLHKSRGLPNTLGDVIVHCLLSLAEQLHRR